MADTCPACRAHLDPQLLRLRTRSGVTAAQWLWAPASGSPHHLVVGPGGCLVAHPPGGGPSSAVRGLPTALPVADKSVGTLVVPLLLPVQEDIDGLFSELRRVLLPHGLLTMLVPTHPSFGFRARRLGREVRAHWRHRSAIDHPDWLAAAADFAVLGDDRLTFTLDTGEDAAETTVDRLCAAGLYPPALPIELRTRVAAHRAQAGSPPRLALRRIVTRR
ncbi:hypothetical protein EV383_1463 [Pseudonocardia sediminis]|uniref:Methyltransferase family protein n=1 Tax=Pseudonocardia sediminis TaxID=1397368 RepID=A0A4Q7USE8_PSEST|nr:hypothetical protein [Pseudonocardia sediminis]RZT84615.1 hypothetical protein EV383_1463 [Pseudonocardia sediminis]